MTHNRPTKTTETKKMEHCRQESNIAVLYEKYDNIETKLDKIDKAVSGNGTRGLKTRLDMIQGALLFIYFLVIIVSGVMAFTIN